MKIVVAPNALKGSLTASAAAAAMAEAVRRAVPGKPDAAVGHHGIRAACPKAETVHIQGPVVHAELLVVKRSGREEPARFMFKPCIRPIQEGPVKIRPVHAG